MTVAGAALTMCEEALRNHQVKMVLRSRHGDIQEPPLLERIGKAPASFDVKKLLAFQERYMNLKTLEEKVELTKPYLQQAGLPSEKLREVLHAAADLRLALGNARSLLAPGGILVALEITRRPLWLDLVFGLTEGWWKFADFDLRPRHPILDAGTVVAGDPMPPGSHSGTATNRKS